MKTICYMRVSSAKKLQRQSTQMQRHALSAWLKQQRIKSTDTVWFEDYSTGRNDKREGFQRMMELCRQGAVSQICVWKLDRLHRDTINTLNTIRELMTLKIKITCLTQGLVFEDNAYSQFLITLTGALASMESAHASERIRAGLAVAKSKGIKLGKPRDDAKRERIQRMIDKGKSIAEVSTRLGCTRANVYKLLKTA